MDIVDSNTSSTFSALNTHLSQLLDTLQAAESSMLTLKYNYWLTEKATAADASNSNEGIAASYWQHLRFISAWQQFYLLLLAGKADADMPSSAISAQLPIAAPPQGYLEDEIKQVIAGTNFIKKLVARQDLSLSQPVGKYQSGLQLLTECVLFKTGVLTQMGLLTV